MLPSRLTGKEKRPSAFTGDEGRSMTTARTAAKVTARTARATATEPRAAPGVSARTRSPAAVDAHPDGDRDLPDRVGLLRDHPGRGPQRHAHHRLPGTRRRPERPSSVCPEPRPAAGTRRRGGLVCASQAAIRDRDTKALEQIARQRRSAQVGNVWPAPGGDAAERANSSAKAPASAGSSLLCSTRRPCRFVGGRR